MFRAHGSLALKWVTGICKDVWEGLFCKECKISNGKLMGNSMF